MKLIKMTQAMNIPTLLVPEAIGNKALKTLSDLRKAIKVQGVFDRSLFIKVGSKDLICVMRDRDFISPISILLNGSEDRGFKSFGIKESMKIEISDGALNIDKILTIKYKNSHVWLPPPPPKKNTIVDLAYISLNLRMFRDVIYTAPSREGLVPLLENVELYGSLKLYLEPQEPTVSERARPHIDLLMRGLFEGDFSMAIAGASSILGLGPGLTPSCDDFLAGLILSLKIGGNALLRKQKSALSFYERVSSEIYREAKEKTTIYSQSFLNEARHGEGPFAMVELVYSLMTKDVHQIPAVAKTAIKMGETSGADFAIGIYFGIRFLVSIVEMIEGLDEFS